MSSNRKPKVRIASGPIPPPGSNRRTTYDWGQVGIPSKDGPTFLVIVGRKTHDVSSTVYAAARRLGKRFSIRQRGPDVEVHLATQ